MNGLPVILPEFLHRLNAFYSIETRCCGSDATGSEWYDRFAGKVIVRKKSADRWGYGSMPYRIADVHKIIGIQIRRNRCEFRAKS